MSSNRVILVSVNNGTEREVFAYEVENLVKQGWKVKGQAKPQPKPETKPKPKTEE
tara:strand:+ start:1768 stop:1932 length:165 start_codon:yes stop_codon:yes gene_type:complete